MRASVIIPCRNAERTVADAVRSALSQTEPPAEVLVVDDASTDGSARVAREAGARVLALDRRHNAGGARNAGIAEASGDLLAFLDADAVAPSDWLARAREAFAERSEVVGVGGRIVNGRPGLYGDLDYFLNHSEWIAAGKPAFKKNIPTMAIVYRREAVGSVRFPESNRGEDTAFALSVLSRGGRLWYDPDIVVTHQHERLDWPSFWKKQVTGGRTIYETRVRHDRPGRILVRFPPLLFLFPHLWIVLARMIRAGRGGRAAAILPWLFLGEVARIRGFFLARREARSGPVDEAPREARA
jgi:glycosyltransferase involved in cell wall biosynthesis